MKVSIIGTAGRKEDGPKMTKALYTKMGYAVLEKLELLAPRSEIELVSGGAAWADHIAVSLWKLGVQQDNRFRSLTLYFPCQFRNSQFIDDSTGKTANYYHRLFSQKVGGDTLRSLELLRGTIGVTFDESSSGFKARNTKVAASDVVIALTWGPGAVPKDGGTKDTWDKSRASTKIHIPLGGL